MDQSESEVRFSIERDVQAAAAAAAAADRYIPNNDRLSLENALHDELSPMDEFNDALNKGTYLHFF